MYKEKILDKIRKAVEQCDSVQCFFLMHSLGGGTGSGLGSYIMGLLGDYFPDIYRFTASVFPQKEDDVVTSPYNSMFSLYELYQHADCVLPIDNQALMNICKQIDNPSIQKQVKENQQIQSKEEINMLMNKGSKITQTGTEEKKEKPFDKMNNIVAHLLSNLTCSMRFEGTLNVDLNEITTNLVPYPELKFLMSSIAPLYSLSNSKMQPRRLDQMFKDIQHPDYQLINCSPHKHTYLALGLMVRGQVSFSDVNRNIKMLRNDCNMIHWNTEGFKYGICNVPPIGQPYSLLCLANNTSITEKFNEMLDRFHKLYKRKVYTHHYTEYMDISHFDNASMGIQDLVLKYSDLEQQTTPVVNQRLKPLI
uniref:B1 epsilon-tubulin 1 n=1 Tax=Philasterides dicentrarchi TaxID=282688 RepID=A0A481SB07_9CILI|nr:B1 epsilon-tubulin 1 [Philasterides dicentrarchi]